MSLSATAIRALNATDNLPISLRECVHEFGFPIVEVCMKHGVTDPRHIRELVKEIWAGARQGGQRTGVWDTLDWILARAEGPLSSKTLLRLLADNNLALVTAEPTRAMLEASMSEVSGFNVRCTREEKHRRRLRAALRAGMEQSMHPRKPKPKDAA